MLILLSFETWDSLCVIESHRWHSCFSGVLRDVELGLRRAQQTLWKQIICVCIFECFSDNDDAPKYCNKNGTDGIFTYMFQSQQWTMSATRCCFDLFFKLVDTDTISDLVNNILARKISIQWLDRRYGSLVVRKIQTMLGPQCFLMVEESNFTRWWFQTFLIFTPIWGRFPFWLIFFRWVETTNQLIICCVWVPIAVSLVKPHQGSLVLLTVLTLVQPFGGWDGGTWSSRRDFPWRMPCILKVWSWW